MDKIVNSHPTTYNDLIVKQRIIDLDLLLSDNQPTDIYQQLEEEQFSLEQFLHNNTTDKDLKEWVQTRLGFGYVVEV